MKDEILDESMDDYPKYGMKSYRNFIYSIVVYFLSFLIFALFTLEIVEISFVTKIQIGLIFIGLIFNIVGFFSGLKSRRLNEIISWKTNIGFLINTIFTILFCLILFVLAKDVYYVFIK